MSTVDKVCFFLTQDVGSNGQTCLAYVTDVYFVRSKICLRRKQMLNVSPREDIRPAIPDVYFQEEDYISRRLC